MMERGSFRAVSVEKAAFAQKVGQVSDVIETPEGFYVVKTLARRPGAERPFEQAQAEIEDKLRQQQYQKLRTRYLQALQAKTTVSVAERFEQLAVDAAVAMFYPES